MYEVKTTKSFQAETEALIEKLKEREFGVLYQVNFKEKIKSKGSVAKFSKKSILV